MLTRLEDHRLLSTLRRLHRVGSEALIEEHLDLLISRDQELYRTIGLVLEVVLIEDLELSHGNRRAFQQLEMESEQRAESKSMLTPQPYTMSFLPVNASPSQHSATVSFTTTVDRRPPKA
jgi:hypothetical protein